MSAGFRSLPPVPLGIQAPSGVSKAGYRSLLAPWIGGASAPGSAPAAAGYRSLLAFWMGGVSGFTSSPVPPTPPSPPVSQLDGRRYEWIFRDDEDICLILASVSDYLF